MRTKFISAVAAAMLIAFPGVSAAQTTDVFVSFQSLMSQLNALKASLTASAYSSLADDYGTGTAGYCPKLTVTMQRGSTDARTGGQVTELQLFLANHYDLDENASVSGFFGAVTARNVVRFQRDQGLPALGIAGALTRAAIARVCGGSAPTTNTNTYVPITVTTSTLTPDQISIISPQNITISVGAKLTVKYLIGSNIVAKNPAIIERSIVRAGTDTQDSGYIAVSQSAGTHSFDWTPSQPGSYQALVKISLNNTQYSARSGIITVVGSTMSSSNLLTPSVSVGASPSSIAVGQGAYLTWSTVNANRCVLQSGYHEENISVNGSKTVYPSVTTSYKVWCTNDPGTGKDGPASSGTATVSVIPPPTCSITSNKSSYAFGESIVLSWTSANATYGGWVPDTSGRDNIIMPGDKLDVHGTHQLTANVYGNPTATLRVYGPSGSGTCMITIPVN